MYLAQKLKKEEIVLENELKHLKKIAVQIRRDIVEVTTHGKGGGIHAGPALSSVEVLTALYFKIMQVKAEDPFWPERDRFILSKGHAYAVWYSALAEKGFFPREELLTMRAINSRLQGHPAYKKTPGVDMTSGSLGNGLACGMGMAMAMKRQGINHKKVYVMLGDGECQEGMVWETAMAAPHKGIDNLVAIIDHNHYQSCGAVDEILPLYPLEDKWKAFGWYVMEMNGHDMADIVSKLTIAKEFAGRPVCIIAHTVKGKGVSFMEHNNKWHNGKCSEEQYVQAMKELDEQIQAIDAGLM